MNKMCNILKKFSQIFTIGLVVVVVFSGNVYGYDYKVNGQYAYCSTSLHQDRIFSCGNGSFSCNEGNSARYTVSYKEGSIYASEPFSGTRNVYECLLCGSGSYPVYDDNDQFSNCASCSSNTDHVATCTNAVDGGCTSSSSRGYWPCYDESASATFACDGRYNKFLNGSGTSKYYTCECRGNGNSSDDVYINNANICQKCWAHSSNGLDNAHKSCDNGGYQCYNWGYLGVDNSGDYYCITCPYVYNASNLGVGNNSVPSSLYSDAVWSSTERCSVSIQKTAESGSIVYTETSQPNTTCKENAYKYSSDSLPNVNTSSLSYVVITQGCDYAVVRRKYTQVAKAGYGATNNNTANAAVQQCTGNTYSTTSMVTCDAVPANSSPNSDHSGWTCNAGYYKDGNTCVRCPLDMNDNLTASNWVIGTSPASAAAVAECYINGSQRGTFSTTSGTYEYTGTCPWDGNFAKIYIPCFDITFFENSPETPESCRGAMAGFFGGGQGGYEMAMATLMHYGVNLPCAIADASYIISAFENNYEDNNLAYGGWTTTDPNQAKSFVAATYSACHTVMRADLID